MSEAPRALTTLDLSEYGLRKVASGKVREISAVDDDSLLFVATDRISAYDVILTNLSSDLTRRSMHVRKFQIIPLESIVRGYITGSAWAEYRKSGTVHGIQMPAGLQESQKLDRPIWTPSTKAEQGAHDENIHPDRAVEIVGEQVARKVEEASLRIYQMAHDYAATRGIIIADTKFEFGLDTTTDEIVLVDEVLTPDSSRFWPADTYQVGKGQSSYDKQYLRDWLTESGLKGKDGVAMTPEVVSETRRKYLEAYEKLTGTSWN